MAASTLPHLLLLALSLFAVSVSVSGRPCKTLFFYTTTSTSYYPTLTTTFSQNPNPTFNIFRFHRDFSYSPKFLTLFFTTVNGREDVENHHPIRLRLRPHPHPKFVSLRRYPFQIQTAGKPLYVEEEVIERDVAKGLAASTMPLGFYSAVTRSSIRDRTRDIMSVVGALLFGVGCGALTAATMYLIWFLFSPNRFEFDDSDDDSFDDIDDDGAPKKMGYMTIPDEDIDAVKKAAQAQALAKEAA